jgi:octaprenyl-diphosphate synthase
MHQTALQELRGAAENGQGGGHGAAVLRHAIELGGLDGPLAAVRKQVEALASAGPQPASEAAEHLLLAGGKAVRPLLTLLCAQAVGGRADQALGCATAAELIHDATLLHDDVIDDGQQRRGRAAARVIWGNTVSVLSGDLLFVAALQVAATDGPAGVLSELLEAVGQMVEGEVIQFRHRGRCDLDLATYEQIVERKTAALFRWCARAGGRAGGGTLEQVDGLGDYGHHVGVAFQIRDDVLDLTAAPAVLGKALGADLAEGKLTLPVLLALQKRPELAPLLQRLAAAKHRPDAASIEQLVVAIRATGSLVAARERMDRELQLALAALAPLQASAAVRALASVAEVVASRQR